MADPGERRRPSREFHGSSQPSSSSSRPVRRRISDDNDEQPAPKTHAGGAGDEQRPSASGRRRHGSSDSRSSSRAYDDRSSSSRGGRSGAGDEDRPSTSRGRRQENSSESRSGAHAGAGDAPRDERSRRGRRDNLEIIHTRPKDCENKTGTSGDPVRLQTNYYRLRKSGNWSIYQYKVTFEPAIEMRRLAAGILSNHRELFGTGYLFDGSLLFNTVKLANKETILNSESKSGEKYTITIKYVGKIEMTQSQSLQILNLILRRSMQGLDLQLVGRNFYDPHALVDLREHRIQLWPGYVTSIRQHETDLLLNVEISHKVMRTETVYDILKKCARESGDFQDAFKRQVIGMTVLTDYNNKTYRIIEVSFGASPKDTFSMKGKDTTFMDYYKEKYNLRVRDPNQPLLVTQSRDKQFGKNAGDDRPIVLIPEFCRATGMTEEMRSNFNLMRAMADHTRMNPDRRIERLRAFNSRLRNAEQSVKVLNEWKLELDRDLVEVKGRILEPQRIKFGTGSVPGTREADWTRCFRDNAMFSQPSRGLYRWYAVAPNRNLRDMRNFIQTMMRVARGLRIDIQQPEEKVLYDDRTHSYIQALEDCARSDPQMIFVLASNNNAERYNAIKKKCCLDRAIPTQVVTQKCAGNARGLMSIATKVAIQINCKLGYTPWTVDIPLSGLMTIGYDVVRSTKDRSKAFGAIVATMDMKVNPTYYSTVAECGANEVVATHIWPMIVKALRQYRAESGDALPTRIILYRDGVSDGSLAQVYSQEVQLIVNNLKKVYEQSSQDKKPKFAFVNVTKSMNTRFFIQSNQRPQNPPPGTVVDSVVTLPEHYDFYLVSQSVRQGTVSPTLYKVLYSSLGLSPDQIQMLTYKMCHLYYNWSGTTRVPAVCQYAKKLATLVSTSLHNTPEAALEKKLYYL